MKAKMKKIIVFAITGIAVFILLASYKLFDNRNNIQAKNVLQYVCMPCGGDCDTTIHLRPGTCTYCNMQLVEKSTIVFKKIDPQQLCSFIQSKGEKNVVLLDVRTPAEFNGTTEDKFGRLKNAINIPIQNLEERINELGKYKEKEIVVYCSHSHRSPGASYMLNQKGFKKVTNMQGGMSVWKDKVKNDDCTKVLFIKQ
jgi:rhodanese-related sulfurtransferase/DNA-directed RNA polymerase subunit RPC12/RpoP